MRAARAAYARWIGLGILVSYPAVTHAILMLSGGSGWGTALIAAEIALMTLVTFAFFRKRMFLALAGVTTAAIMLAFRASSPDLIVAANGVPHALVNMLLMLVFGRSLMRGEKPIITMVAEMLGRESLPPEILRYTRRVTQLWCGFFALEVIGSALLLAFAPFSVWSLFVNVLTLPLVISLFLIEYTYRRLRFRDYRHRGILETIMAFGSGEMMRSWRSAKSSTR